MATKKTAAAAADGDDRCDNCGACKTCGQGGRQQFIPYPYPVPYPQYPRYPQAWWGVTPQPYYSGTNLTNVTSSWTNNSGGNYAA